MKLVIKIITLLLLFCAIIIIACGVGYICNDYKNYSQYSKDIKVISENYDVDPLLIISMIKVESNFNTYAVSKKGAIGIMQILPSTAKDIIGYNEFDEEILYRPEINIDIGVRYVKYLLKIFNNDIKLMLAAYNAGIGNVSQWYVDSQTRDYDENKILFKETKKYVKKVNRIYKILRVIF